MEVILIIVAIIIIGMIIYIDEDYGFKIFISIIYTIIIIGLTYKMTRPKNEARKILVGKELKIIKDTLIVTKDNDSIKYSDSLEFFKSNNVKIK